MDPSQLNPPETLYFTHQLATNFVSYLLDMFFDSHPAVQEQLSGFIESIGKGAVAQSHNTEWVYAAKPDEILLFEKFQKATNPYLGGTPVQAKKPPTGQFHLHEVLLKPKPSYTAMKPPPKFGAKKPPPEPSGLLIAAVAAFEMRLLLRNTSSTVPEGLTKLIEDACLRVPFGSVEIELKIDQANFLVDLYLSGPPEALYAITGDSFISGPQGVKGRQNRFKTIVNMAKLHVPLKITFQELQ